MVNAELVNKWLKQALRGGLTAHRNDVGIGAKTGGLLTVRIARSSRSVDRHVIRSILVAAIALVAGACSTYRATMGAMGDTVQAVGQSLKTPNQPVPNVDLTNANWQKLSADQPDTNPIRVAVVARDERVGATRVVLKVPPNHALPPYWLTSDGTYTVMKGTFVFDTVDAQGRPEKLTQTPGAFARVPAHLIQRAATRAGEEGLLYITVYGDWSPNFAEGAWGPVPRLRAGS